MYTPSALNINIRTLLAKTCFYSLLSSPLYSPFDELLVFLILLLLFFHINYRISFHDSLAQQEVIPKQLLLPGGYCISFHSFGAQMHWLVLLITVFLLVNLNIILRRVFNMTNFTLLAMNCTLDLRFPRIFLYFS